MGNNAKTYGSALAELDAYLGELQKTASETGEDSTAHPVQSEDGQLSSATEGSRSAENESDVTSDVGVQNINDAAPAKDEEPAPVALTTAATTGKDPANETSSAKMDKEDPGTSHPAKAASVLEVIQRACAEKGAEKVASDLGNEIMADIAVMNGGGANGTDLEKASAAGAAAADSEIEKLAAAQLPVVVENLTKEAAADAERLFEFYHNFEKAAMGAEGEPEEAVSGEEAAAGDAGEEGALPPEDLQQLEALAGGAGAVPPEAAAMPPEAALGGEMAEPEAEEVVDALSAALEDAGVTPEEFAAAVAAQEGAADMPIEEKMAAHQIAGLAASEVNRYRNLRAAGRLLNVKKANIQLTWTIRQMLKDVMGR